MHELCAIACGVVWVQYRMSRRKEKKEKCLLVVSNASHHPHLDKENIRALLLRHALCVFVCVTGGRANNNGIGIGDGTNNTQLTHENIVTIHVEISFMLQLLC